MNSSITACVLRLCQWKQGRRQKTDGGRFVLKDIILLILYTSGLMKMTVCSFRLGKMTGRKRQFPVSPPLFVHPSGSLYEVELGWEQESRVMPSVHSSHGVQVILLIHKVKNIPNPAFSCFCIELLPQCLFLSSLHLGAN